jgi:putative DNA primase/helicase
MVAQRRDEAPILRLSLQDIAFKLGGHVERGHVRAPGPGQSKTNRSMKVTVGSQYPDGFIVKWFAGSGQADDLRAKEDVLDRLGFEPWSPRSSSKRTERSAVEIEAEVKTEAERITQSREKAGSIWRKKGNPKDPKGIVRAYLQSS